MSDTRELVFPGPLGTYPRPLEPRDIVLIGAKSVRVAGTAPFQVSNVPTLVTMVTLEAGASTATLRLFNSANLETTIDRRIGSVRAATFDGWSHSRGIIADKGVVAVLDQADAEAFVYIITAIG